MKTVAMVPIKLNNERLPGKNTKILGDKPLIAYILNSLKASSGIDEIIVYCSNQTICDYLPCGVKFLKRPQELDQSKSNFTQIFTKFMEDVDADFYVFTHATAPFIKPQTITECIEKVKNEDYDSAFTASMIQDFLWQNNMPMNFDATNLPRSQDLKPVYRETSGLYVFKKEVFQNLKQRIGKKPYIKNVSFREAVDINNPEDFKLAEALLNTNL